MIELSSAALQLRVDPEAGAGVTSLIERGSGSELLFQAPWPLDRHADRASGNEGWARGWSGGWNLLAPNAGEPCVVGGVSHAYHGAASSIAWQTLDASAACARLACGVAGLIMEREVEVDGRVVSARTRVRNARDQAVAFIAVEHPIFGGSLAAEGAVLEVRAPRAAVRERVVVPTAPWSWFRAICGPELSSTLTSADGALRVRVDSRGFSALWLWAEQSATLSAPWDGSASCIGIEPATSSDTRGLAHTIEEGTARRLEVGAEAVFELQITVEPPARY